MVQWRARSLAAVGAAVAGVALSACGSGASPAQAGGTSGPGGSRTGVTATPATAPPSTASGSGVAPVLIVRSFDGSVSYDGREPTTVAFSGDSTNIVTHLTWSSWGPGAAGQGQLGLDDCQPNCAQGHVTEVPATLDLGAVADGHYTTITEVAAGTTRHFSYPSTWATSAS